jgi:hypothetical protein
VRIGGVLPDDLVVELFSSDTSELTVPATVTIPAGQTSAVFTLTYLDDTTGDGAQTAEVSAVAAGLGSDDATMVVHDRELHHVGIDPITGSRTASVAFAVTARAYNVDNEVIPNCDVSPALTASGQSGSLTVNPGTISIVSGVWTGNVTVHAVDPAAVLQLSVPGLAIAESNAFTLVAGPVAQLQWGSVGPVQYVNTPFPATLTAKDANGYTVTQFNGSTSLSVWGLTQQTSVTMMNSVAPNRTANNGLFTLGYTFTPTTDITVTHLRACFGTKVSIWTNSGTLLGSVPISTSLGAWAEAPLAASVRLSAGVTYRIGAFTAGSPRSPRSARARSSPVTVFRRQPPLWITSRLTCAAQ